MVGWPLAAPPGLDGEFESFFFGYCALDDRLTKKVCVYPAIRKMRQCATAPGAGCPLNLLKFCICKFAGACAAQYSVGHELLLSVISLSLIRGQAIRMRTPGILEERSCGQSPTRGGYFWNHSRQKLWQESCLFAFIIRMAWLRPCPIHLVLQLQRYNRPQAHGHSSPDFHKFASQRY
jgi:hypothetical protein